MTARRERMKCPRCGGDMNFHAEKVDYARALADSGVMDPDLGGPLEEFHTCPRCRLTVEVPARD